MKHMRFASVAILAVALAAMVFSSARTASGQSAQQAPAPEAVQVFQDFELNRAGNNVIQLEGPAGQHPYDLMLNPSGGPDPEMRKLLNEEAESEREAASLVKEY